MKNPARSASLVDNWGVARPDLDFQPLGAVARIMRLSRFIDKGIKDFLAGHDLEPGEFDVLTTLRRSDVDGGMTISAFREASLVTGGAITNRLDRMAAKGLIERIPDRHDRRVTRIVLTHRGTELIDTILPEDLDRLSRLLDPLGDTETGQLVDHLRTLLAAQETELR